MKDKNKKQTDPLPAATVILTRQHAGELQVYLLKRNANSGFMAGNYVFPGGMVEPEDGNIKAWIAHVDLARDGLAQNLGGGLTATQTLAYGIAAIRETFEEAGVLLAFKPDKNSGGLKRIHQMRLSGDLRNGWFLKFAASKGWILALSALSRWSHWITPELMKRRYDTRFFISSLPPGQHCQPDARETIHGIWISPENGLAGNLNGEIPLSPPTLITLHQLLKYPTLKDLEKEANIRLWGKVFLPRLVPLDQGLAIVEPWDSQYTQKEIDINSNDLEASLLPVGKSFSRIWYHKGIWRPVAN